MEKSAVVLDELPSEFSSDPLTEVIHAGARELLATAVLAEVSGFIADLTRIFWTRTAVSAWCATGSCQNAR
jgi:hypothetical protein